jgi:hypothetical protein
MYVHSVPELSELLAKIVYTEHVREDRLLRSPAQVRPDHSKVREAVVPLRFWISVTLGPILKSRFDGLVLQRKSCAI